MLSGTAPSIVQIRAENARGKMGRTGEGQIAYLCLKLPLLVSSSAMYVNEPLLLSESGGMMCESKLLPLDFLNICVSEDVRLRLFGSETKHKNTYKNEFSLACVLYGS